jgi:hypothetical protein
MRFILLLLLVLCSSPPAHADTYLNGPIATSRLKGLDTVIVSLGYGPSYQIMKDDSSYSANVDTLDTAAQTVKEVFSKQPWITIHSTRDFKPSQDIHKPNFLVMAFMVSAQPDKVSAGLFRRPVIVASLSMKLFYWDTEDTYVNVGTIDATYPFVAPSDHAEFNARVADGVRYLTFYIPSHMYCANKFPDIRLCPFDHQDIRPWSLPTSNTLFE